MANNELMMLMACRHAVVSKIQEGSTSFTHRNDEDELETVPYRDVVDLTNIECITDVQQSVPAVPLNRIKEAREEMAKGWYTRPANRYEEGKKDRSLECMHILDKIIAEVEENK